MPPVPFLAVAWPTADYLFDSAVLLLFVLLPPPELFSLHPFTAYAFLDETVLDFAVFNDTLSLCFIDLRLGLT